MPQSTRTHTSQPFTTSDPLGTLFVLAVGQTTAIFPVYAGMVVQTLLCPGNLVPTSVTKVEMSTDYSPGSLDPFRPGSGTWYAMYSSGNIAATIPAYAFSFYVTSGAAVRFSPADFYGANWVRLTFNTAQTGTPAVFTCIDGQVTGA